MGSLLKNTDLPLRRPWSKIDKVPTRLPLYCLEEILNIGRINCSLSLLLLLRLAHKYTKFTNKWFPLGGSIYTWRVPRLCDHNPSWAVIRRVHDTVRSQKQEASFGILSGMGDPYRNLWLSAHVLFTVPPPFSCSRLCIHYMKLGAPREGKIFIESRQFKGECL